MNLLFTWGIVQKDEKGREIVRRTYGKTFSLKSEVQEQKVHK